MRARTSDEIAHRLETIRDPRYGRSRLRFVYRARVVEGELSGFRRTIRAGGADEITIELTQVSAPPDDPMRAGTTGHSANDLAECGMRALFLGEPLPEQFGILGFMAETGINADELRDAFALSNEIAPAVAVSSSRTALSGSGHARRVTAFELGPRVGDRRRVAVEWEVPQPFENEPTRRSLEGEWTLA